MKRLVLTVLTVLIVAGAGFLVWAKRHPELPLTDAAAKPSFPDDLVATGAQLAAAGDCAACHTRPGGGALAGGRPLPTPFGTIHSTNITPDRETGIGGWSEAAFRRAMHEGVDRKGNYLYPAFPYDHFTKVTAGDVKAIYAYLMTRPAVKAPAAANDLPFPFNQRILMAGWNLLFLDRGPFKPEPGRSDAWNRGAYLAEGLAHCGACHSPRNTLGAVDESRAFAGGEAEGWHAPALGRRSGAPVPWTKEALTNYLIDGWDARHGIAGGPMTDVVNGLARLSESDVAAIAEYVTADAGQPPADKADQALAFARAREFTAVGGKGDPGTPEGRGEMLFGTSCATCHRQGGQTAPLALATSLSAPSARNVIGTILHGVRAPAGSPDLNMPAFGAMLKDEQIADLAAFMRARFSRGPAWSDIAGDVKRARQSSAGY